jgi:hypothetical protein
VLHGSPFKFGNGGAEMHLFIVPPQGWDKQSFSCKMHDDGKFLDLKWAMPEIPLTKGIAAACKQSKEADEAFDFMLDRWENMGYTGKHSMTYALPVTAIYHKDVNWSDFVYSTGSTVMLVTLLLRVETSVARVSHMILGPVKKVKIEPYVAPPPNNNSGNGNGNGSGGTTGN